MKNKKALEMELSSRTLILLLIAILAAAVVFSTYTTIVKSFGGEFLDLPCLMNSKLRSLGPTPGALTQTVTGAEGAPMWLCPTYDANVKANDWDECDSEERGWEEAYKESRNDVYLRKCVVYQIRHLGYRCWSRYGSGELNLGNIDEDCFDVTVTGLKEGDHFIEVDIEEELGGVAQHFDRHWTEDVDYEEDFKFDIEGFEEDSGNGEYIIRYKGSGPKGLILGGYSVDIGSKDYFK